MGGLCWGQKGEPPGWGQESGQEQDSRAQGTVRGSALSDREGRKLAETRGNKKPHALAKPPAATDLVLRAEAEAKPQRHNEEGA